MSRERRITRPPKKMPFGLITAVAAALAALGLVAFFALSRPNSESAPNSASLASSQNAQVGPASATPVLPTQPLELLGVEVATPVIDLGRVPLNTGVKGVWVMRNTSASPVSVGRPGIEVLDGC